MRASVALGLLVGLGALLPRTSTAEGFEAVLVAELEQLTAEKGALLRGLAEAEETTRSARAVTERELEALTAELVELRAANAMRSEQLPEAERAHSLEDQARQLVQVGDQIRAWAHTRDLALPADAPVDDMVERALAHIQQQGSLHVEEAEYFDEDGMARTGSLLHVARVAAVVRAAPPVPLVLVADGSLRAARGIEPGAGPVPSGEVLRVVLFDPLEAHTADSYHRESWAEWMRRGGAIMWPLAGLGLIGLLLSIERAFALLRAGIGLRRFRRDVAQSADAVKRYEGDRLLAPAVIVLTSVDQGPDLEERAADALLRAKATLDRGVSFLAITASVAPLIGLLGTVTGMIRTFAVITDHGTGDPRLLSAGISEALLTTQLGLMVAVPALLLHSGLLRWSQVIVARVEDLAVEALQRRRELPPNA